MLIRPQHTGYHTENKEIKPTAEGNRAQNSVLFTNKINEDIPTKYGVDIRIEHQRSHFHP